MNNSLTIEDPSESAQARILRNGKARSGDQLVEKKSYSEKYPHVIASTSSDMEASPFLSAPQTSSIFTWTSTDHTSPPTSASMLPGSPVHYQNLLQDESEHDYEKDQHQTLGDESDNEFEREQHENLQDEVGDDFEEEQHQNLQEKSGEDDEKEFEIYYKTRAGKQFPRMFYDGYEYVGDFVYGENHYWKCRMNHSIKCPGRAITKSLSTDERPIITKNHAANHLPEFGKSIAGKNLGLAGAKAVNSHKNPRPTTSHAISPVKPSFDLPSFCTDTRPQIKRTRDDTNFDARELDDIDSSKKKMPKQKSSLMIKPTDLSLIEEKKNKRSHGFPNRTSFVEEKCADEFDNETDEDKDTDSLSWKKSNESQEEIQRLKSELKTAQYLVIKFQRDENVLKEKVHEQEYELIKRDKLNEEKLSELQAEINQLKAENKSKAKEAAAGNFLFTADLIKLYSNLNSKFRSEAYESLRFANQNQNVKEFKLKLLFSVIVVSFCNYLFFWG
jgi:uncharacterized small protein (DUF1192 family)